MINALQLDQAATRYQRYAHVHRTTARILFVGVVVQFFFAGLGVFTITSFLPHAIMGTLVILASIALPIIALKGHLERQLAARSFLVVVFMFVQGFLIDLGQLIHLFWAFHPVNALVVGLLVYSLAQRTIPAPTAPATTSVGDIIVLPEHEERLPVGR